jgi:hypothetical protein
MVDSDEAWVKIAREAIAIRARASSTADAWRRQEGEGGGRVEDGAEKD